MSEVEFWTEYFSHVPPPNERIEFMLAQLTALMSNVNRGKGSAAARPTDFLPFADAWKRRAEKQATAEGRFTDLDREILAVFMRSS